ncbi:glutathione synthetase-like [Periophthalmus magnuspinnatus]|uniref:glutathione synthetase-like n=1 Tax=Periophthalmus magnuspinnatus TaxID=409849 RepID=UPI0024373C7F|nr:glutathione synthetase-like [Periophthalmus magnuspinnatus]
MSKSCPGLFEALLKDEALLQPLVEFARDAACLHGVLMRPPPTMKPAHVTLMPFTLLPIPMPRALYFQAVEVQTLFNTLVDRVSQDEAFLEKALSSTIEVDDFTARLFHIYKQIQREGRTPSIVLGLNRCDYMLDQGSSLKQVEINTFAVGMGGLSARLVEVHRDVLRYAGRPEESEQLQQKFPSTLHASAVAKAWELYGSHRAVVLLLVLPTCFNRPIQRYLEMALLRWNICVIRRSLEEVCASASLDEENRLFVDGREIAVVYFRYGHAPDHYTEQIWDLRLLLERSRAVKVPDIATHLAGTKKVQQVLSEPGVLERFFPERPHVVEQIRATFTGLYSLDLGPEGDRAVDMALAAPERFVLKPQREGGGNNFFGSDISRVLTEAPGKERTAYILMDKIQATPSPNIIVSAERPPVLTDCTCELGVAGAYVRQDRDVLTNEVVGVLLRSKMAEYAEGGITIGRGAISTPFLV